MNQIEQVYRHVKEFIKKNGYPQSYSQIARELNLKKHEVEEAMEKLEENGRIKITRIPTKTKIEFMD